MSLVHRCDRCRAISDNYATDQKEGVQLPDGWHYLTMTCTDRTHPASICFECWNALYDWFHAPPVSEEST